MDPVLEGSAHVSLNFSHLALLCRSRGRPRNRTRSGWFGCRLRSVSAASTPEPDEHEVLLMELVEVARLLGLEVRSERFESAGPVSGALCRVRGKQIILLDRGAPSYERAHTVAAVLSRYAEAPIAMGSAAWHLVRRAGRQRKAGGTTESP